MGINFYKDEIKKYKLELALLNLKDTNKSEFSKARAETKEWYIRWSIRECEDTIEKLNEIKEV